MSNSTGAIAQSPNHAHALVDESSNSTPKDMDDEKQPLHLHMQNNSSAANTNETNADSTKAMAESACAFINALHSNNPLNLKSFLIPPKLTVDMVNSKKKISSDGTLMMQKSKSLFTSRNGVTQIAGTFFVRMINHYQTN